MPLLDHFYPPLSVERPREGMHSTWAASMATQLNQDQLPEEYFAMPLVTIGGGLQVDVETFQTGVQQERTNGGIAIQAWAPPQPVSLWLSEELCLPLALEESYRATCAALRIR